MTDCSFIAIKGAGLGHADYELLGAADPQRHRA